MTYALVAALIAATFVGVPVESRGTLDNAVMLALGFFFKGVLDSTDRNTPTGGTGA